MTSNGKVLLGLGIAFIAALALAIVLLFSGGTAFGTNDLPGGITSGDI